MPKKVLHIGVVGYPNTGKSSFIKLFNDKYRTIIKSNNMTENPEIVINNSLRIFSIAAHVLAKNELGPLMPKTTKDVEELKSPIDIVKLIVDAIAHDTLLEIYEIADFECHISFLENIAKNKNFRIKGGYLDHERAARSVIEDVINGKIKFETPFE
jgi:nuclear GTP-binding protein